MLPGPRGVAPRLGPGWAGAIATLAQTRYCIWAACCAAPGPALAAGPLPLGASRWRARPPPRLSAPRSGAWRPVPGPGLPCRPPAFPFGPCARCRAPRALSPVRLPVPCRRCAAGSLAGDRSPLLRLRRGPWAARPPRGGGCGPASGCGPPGARLRLARAASGPGAPRGAPRRGLWAALFFSGGPRFAARGLAACCPLSRLLCGSWGSPLRPPPAAPAGGSGSARPAALAGSRFSRPCLPCPPRRGRAPGPRCGPVNSPKIVNRVLTFRRVRAIFDSRGLFRPSGGCSIGHPWTAESPSPFR